MKINVIILCGGNGKRWNKYLGVEKHNININGEALIDRTIRLVETSQIEAKITIVSNTSSNWKVQKENVEIFIPDDSNLTNTEADKLLSSACVWNNHGRTIILLGDVWYSEKAIKRIISFERKKWVVFGRQQASSYTRCSHGELFAWSFWHCHNAKFKQELQALVELYNSKKINIASGWGHYNIRSDMAFLMVNCRTIKGYAITSNFYHIDDFTEDFDYPKDYHNWLSAYKLWAETSPFKRLARVLFSLFKRDFLLVKNLMFQYCYRPVANVMPQNRRYY